MNIFAPIGRVFLAFLAETGRLTLFTFGALTSCVSAPIYWRMLGQQMMRIGYFSLPVVGLTAFFTGGALALQIYIGGNRFGAEAVVPQHRGARHHARAWSGDRGLDGGGPRRRRDRGRDSAPCA